MHCVSNGKKESLEEVCVSEEVVCGSSYLEVDFKDISGKDSMFHASKGTNNLWRKLYGTSDIWI